MSIIETPPGDFADLESFLARPSGILIADGAMGTLLLELGFKPPLETLNLSHPDVIRDIHRRYVKVGARLIYTHTFGANTERFSTLGLDADLDAIISAAVINARKAAPRILVVGNIGPCGVSAATVRQWRQERLRQVFSRTAAVLESAGVDAFALETFTSLAELESALSAVAWVNKRSKPVIACVSPKRDGTLADGTTLKSWVQALNAGGKTDVIGINCGFAPAEIANVVQQLCADAVKPIAVKLNAGIPARADCGAVYPVGPDEFARQMAALHHPRIRIIGGCCGTTPEHIAVLASAFTKKRAIPMTRVKWKK